MKRFVSIGVRNPIFVNILLMIILMSGVIASFMLVREVLPEFSVDTVQVQVLYPGAGPEEVEEGICLKLEDAIEGIEGIKKYQTTASEFMGSALIEADSNYDIEKLKEDVTDKINAIVTFPAGAERPIINELTTRGQVLLISLYGDLTERQLKEVAEQTKEDLLRLPSVTQVSLAGVRRYEISIEISEERLRRYGMTFDDVSRAVRRASENWPGGTVRGKGEQIKIRTMGRRYTGEDYGKIVLLARADGTSIRLGQVATIRDGFEEDEVYGFFNGKASVLINVFKTKEEDALAISQEVREYVKGRNEKFPQLIDEEGVARPSARLQVWSDSSRFINDRLNLLIRNGRIGLLLVFLLLWIFLDLRLAFWCSMGIPISLAGALALMGTTDQTINMISMFALIMILGIIVDDAIVVGEAIYVHRREGKSAIRAAIDGATEVGLPVFAAVMTTIVAFIPLMFVGGIMGKFIRVLPVAVIAALVISLIESLVMLPCHLRHLPDQGAPDREGYGLRHKLKRLCYNLSHTLEWVVERIYIPFIRHILHWRYVTLAGAIAILLISFGVYQGGFVKFQIFPKMDTDFVYSQVEFPNGTPFEVTRDAIQRIEDGLRKVAQGAETKSGEPMVEALYSIIGSGIGFAGAVGPNIGAVFVEMLPTERRDIYYEKIISEWEENVGRIPGALNLKYETPQTGPGGKAIEVWLQGENMDELREASGRLKAKLGAFAGVFQIEDDFRPGKRELRTRLKPEARNLGLNDEDLGRQLRQGFYGDEVLRLQRGRDDLKVWIRYPRDERRSLADVERIRIRTSEGDEVPLASVAEVSLEQGYATIHRQDGSRRIVVIADVDTTQANAREIVTYLESTFLGDLTRDYPGMYATIEGQNRETAKSLGSLKVGFPIAMLGIFLILATIFHSYIQPIVIMITIPFGLIGATFGHMVMGFDLTMLSMFGMVALSGIVVNDAIVLIVCINERVAGGIPLFQALCEGGARRFRAIVLTTLTTSFGLAPLILEKSMQAQFLIPMAISIAFGVAFASLLTLILIPCLLLILSDARLVFSWFKTGTMPKREEVEPAALRLREGEASAEA